MCDDHKEEKKYKQESINPDSRTDDKRKKPILEEEKIEICGSYVPVHIELLTTLPRL